MKIKKIIALLLCFILLFSVTAQSAAAFNKNSLSISLSKESAEHVFYRIVDDLIRFAGKFLNSFIPGLNTAGKIPDLKDYESEYFYPGKEKFDTQASASAGWKMGFSEKSFIENINVFEGSYYMAGSLSPFKGRVPVKSTDDQGVNTFALSDGDTTVVYSAIDGFGFARGDVLEIRKRLDSFAEEHGINSINVCALHQHSCIDTLGLGAPIVPALLVNPAATTVNEDLMVRGRNKKFMEELYSAVVTSVIEAVENMTEGSLYYGSNDVSEYIRDKREPQMFDKDLERLRFIPDDKNKKEIWVCEAGIHPVTIGTGTDVLSADYPYYMEQYIKDKAGADFVFIQGAELAITSRIEVEGEETDEVAGAKALGNVLGKKATEINREEALSPVLNVAFDEITIKAENPVHILAAREGLLSSTILKKGLDYYVKTELGYMELGGKIGVALVPGEIEPAILWGNAATKEMSWKNTSWDYAPWAENCKAEKLICFGLCNDQIGYILTDNDVRSMLTENEEINALTEKAGSVLTECFENLMNRIK